MLFCLLLEKLWCLVKFRCGKGGRANEKQNLVSVLSHEKVSCFSRSATKKGLVREAEGRERHEMPTQNDSQAKKNFSFPPARRSLRSAKTCILSAHAWQIRYVVDIDYNETLD